jgi:hypothetical protein
LEYKVSFLPLKQYLESTESLDNLKSPLSNFFQFNLIIMLFINLIVASLLAVAVTALPGNPKTPKSTKPPKTPKSSGGGANQVLDTTSKALGVTMQAVDTYNAVRGG